MKRSLLGGVVLLVVAACGQVGSDSHGRGGGPRFDKTKQDLTSYDSNDNEETQIFWGTDLADHELALTFDDGPGPMEVTGAFAQWLKDKKIQATFFVNGACVKSTTLSESGVNNSCEEPTEGADAVLAKVVSLGHYVGNHTTTHRSVTTEMSLADAVKEVTDTDNSIKKYLVWNRTFLRTPYGDWNDDVFKALNATAMKKYTGSVYWNVGGGPTNANQAADWECWEKNFTTKQCGDRYLKEIKAHGNKGIVLMHEAKGDPDNHSLTSGQGNTVDMVKYVIGELDKDAKPWKYKRLDEIPSIAAVLPKCDASCDQCSGPAATECTSCPSGKKLDAGKCVAGGDTESDGGASSSSSGSTTSSSGSTSSSSGASSGDTNASSGSNNASSGGNSADAGADAPKDEGGCNASGGSGGASTTAVLLGLAAVISRRSKRRRT